MDDNQVLRQFRKKKIATIEQLVNWLGCSTITVRRRLKRWRSLTSINKNGRYYTLPRTPIFDRDGLWEYQRVLFSKHGNLKQTIVTLITNADKGLTAAEIARRVDLKPNSSFISRIKDVSGIRREKHFGRYVYLSGNPEIYSLQKYALADQCHVDTMPTDQEAVMILVELVKQPNIEIEEIAARVSRKGILLAPATIRSFLQTHDLLKKTSDTQR